MDDDAVSASMTDQGDRPANILSSTQKTLALLETLASLPRPYGVSELARVVGSSRGTVHKQLATLVASGWVEQDGQGRYGLGLLAVRVGNTALQHAGLGQKIQNVLEGLVAVTGETATIAAVHRDSGLIIQRAESDQVLSADIRVGTRIPLNVGASNHVLLTFAITEEQRHDLRRRGVELPSEEYLAGIAESGVAFTRREFVDGIDAVSIPLQHQFDFKTTALTLAGPSGRIHPDSAERALRAARERILALAASRVPKLRDASGD
ncbi:IclR family transcriptional regulator [Pseudonocardia sp. CA-142604]|uniref:IclR family transcriptional regulator n=1 Tax=Pseudonocardia sp. CA-142604 TaxID=3240024 RepID=UPI003D901CA3